MSVVPLHTSLSDRIVDAARMLGAAQRDLVMLAADLADSPEWIVAGSPTPAHHLAALADVEPCTAREWIRVGKRVRGLPTIAERFVSGVLSYSKVRALIGVATPENEAELADLAMGCSAAELRVELARWLRNHTDPERLDAHHRGRRSVTWRTEADGMVTFTLRLQPHMAAILITLLTKLVMRTRPRPRPDEPWPTLAQQHADAFADVLTDGVGKVITEVILHVRGDGATCDDGTPISDTVIAQIAAGAFIRAMIHDAEGRPINASGRHRHPSTRQKLVVKERDRVCVDCGRADLLTYDHVPAFEHSRRTVVGELKLRCSPCHHIAERRRTAGRDPE